MFGPKSLKELKKATKLVRSLMKRYRKRIPVRDAEALESVLEASKTILDSGDAEAAQAQLDALHTASEMHLAPHRNSSLYENVESVGIAIMIALVLRAFVIEAFTIPSGSMIPTLAVGDFLFVNKLAYGTRVPFTEKTGVVWDMPERGDIIVFVYPCNPKQDYIKRVVAIEGDIVEPYGGGNNSFVAVNGVPVTDQKLRDFHELNEFRGGEISACIAECRQHFDEARCRTQCEKPKCGQPYTLHEESSAAQSYSKLHCIPKAGGSDVLSKAPVSDWGSERLRAQSCATGSPVLPAPYPWRVPKGHVFVMGDNRDNSLDSRFWGFVPVESVKGKALFMWMSWDGAASWSSPWEKVRWNRLFRPVHRVYNEE